tara:strand:- start:74 stop:496 length:423 start_codon:yes stop_codon:yes gene_type:complete
MRVNRFGQVRDNTVKRVKNTAHNQVAIFANSIKSNNEESFNNQVNAPSSLTPVDALIAIQEVGDSNSGKSRAILRGKHMLGLLEEVRIGLLSGNISKSKLDSLLTSVKTQRDNISEPRLTSILDEIELRASVELAKLGKT